MGKLHHLALGALDVAGLAAFYRDRLGLREVRRQHEPEGALRSVWLDLGGALLMIERAEEPSCSVACVGTGVFLLALRLEARRRGELEETLAAAGFPAESRTEHTTYFRDPEGNRVALSSYPIGEYV
jgi:catechol 2,3-dioxygenase-like lactoylglutathione lyase family enzyme